MKASLEMTPDVHTFHEQFFLSDDFVLPIIYLVLLIIFIFFVIETIESIIMLIHTTH